jgi:spore coat polysaccharide biosynthesis protein SpsF
MKTVATIEARMTSSRLPGKVLLEAAGVPMLEHLVRRLRAVPSLHGIVLATTINPTDDVLEDFARKAGIGCHRGSEEDVMVRVIGAARSADADVVVEITGDCPIIDPDIVEQVIRSHRENDAAYVSNAHVRSYPDGMDVQVFRRETLEKSAAMTDDELDHEHVTLHIRNNPQIFKPVHVVAPPSLHWPELGLTLDEPGDYALLKHLIETLGGKNPLFGCGEVLAYLRANPTLVELNRGVVRKGDT